MKITKVDIFRWETGINAPVGCRIYTDEGIYGDGEAALAYGKGSHSAFGALLDLAPLVVGMNPMENEVIWYKLFEKSFWAQNGGPAIYGGISAIDMALWDIKGKALGIPVHTLLGGKKNTKLRVYASQLQMDWGPWQDEKGQFRITHMRTPEDYARAGQKAVAEGYTALKYDFIQVDKTAPYASFTRFGGLQSTYLLGMVEERLAAVREAVGPDVDILMEWHGDLDAVSAEQIAKVVEPYKPFCFEEPSLPFPGLTKEIRQRVSIPIAHGERMYNRWQVAPFLEDHSVQLLQPDLGTCGGITEGKKIADMAFAYDVGIQCHICASNFSIAPALQLEAAIPNFVIHEHHVILLQEETRRMALYDYQPVKGYYDIPDLPGLGNEWSEYALSTAKSKVTIPG